VAFERFCEACSAPALRQRNLDRLPAACIVTNQLSATDSGGGGALLPDVLEQRLGTVQSKGCSRIPASLNEFIDRYAVLDEDYEKALDEGRRFWVLRSDWTPTPWSGRYLVVVESMAMERPAWSPAPATRR
jgi:hypothetical protein